MMVTHPSELAAALGLALSLLLPSVVMAQISSPARPVPGYKNAASFGLSYGVQNDRDATFWGWSAEYSRQLGGHWITAGSIMWDRETERVDNRPDVQIDTFTLSGTISYALTKRLAITTGLGKGFADTDNSSESMRFVNGALSTGIVLGWSTPGFKHLTRDSIAFAIACEYNITQSEVSYSFDVAFGWSF